jgi:hypothetical protein
MFGRKSKASQQCGHRRMVDIPRGPDVVPVVAVCTVVPARHTGDHVGRVNFGVDSNDYREISWPQGTGSI